jgi:Ca-activated chloride channel family protein
VIFIFDGSISMGLPLGLDPAEEDRLDDGVRRRDPEARRAYRALLQQPGPKRMGRAQAAFSDAAAELPEAVELGLIVFQECRDIRSIGVFDAASRGSAIDYVQRLIPHGRTPLAQSLASAAAMLGDGPSSIVLLTDGIEFCSGDPCAAAEEVKAAHPQTPIHIIDVTGQARTACVAEITGGRSYAPAETDDLTAVMRNAFRGAAPRCKAPG